MNWKQNVRNAPTEEPVTLAGVLNTAIAATCGVVVIAADVAPELAGGVTIAIAAWMGVLAYFTRKRTQPFQSQ